MESVANILRLEHMPKCDCGSGQEVIFICKNEKCKYNYLTYYCLNCSLDESNHDHRGIPIVKELDALVKKWNELKVGLTTTYEEAKKRYSAMEPLIKYLEEAMLDPEATFVREIEWISA